MTLNYLKEHMLDGALERRYLQVGKKFLMLLIIGLIKSKSDASVNYMKLDTGYYRYTYYQNAWRKESPTEYRWRTS